MRQRTKFLSILALAGSLGFVAGCKDKEVRTYLQDVLVPLVTKIGTATCNLDVDQNPADHAPLQKMCEDPPDFTTPPPPPRP
jgi:hypothetical protein